MLTRMATWVDVESMPCFERVYFYNELVKARSDKEGNVVI